MIVSLSSLVLEPDAKARSRIKSAVQAASAFTKCFSVSSLLEGYKYLAEDPYDVIFISHHYGKETIDEFLQKAKTISGSAEAAIVLVVPAEGAELVVKNILTGADGILVEPFSVEQLGTIVNIAQQVKGNHQERRDRLASKVIAGELLQLIDLIAVAKAFGVEAAPAIRRLKVVSSSLKTYSSAVRESFLEQLLVESQSEEITAKRNSTPTSRSDRIKKLYIDKISREMSRLP